MNKILLVGLGNPGDKFIRTRHNIGVRLLNDWVQTVKSEALQVKEWRTDSSSSSEVAEVTIGDKRIDCIFPLTFMNDSGRSVASYIKKQGIKTSDILVIHDDLEIPFGTLKFKEQGGAAGHKGVRSIHQYLGTQDIARLRIGIGRPPEGIPVDRFVLQKFTGEEELQMKALSDQVSSQIIRYTHNKE